MNRKKQLQFDPLTEQISEIILKIPRVGKDIARLYLWKPMMFNFMIVGASGTILSWILYEQLFRILFLPLPGGTFIAMIITTCLIFLWNYTWNRKWSLHSDAQIMHMTKQELMELKNKIEQLLKQKFDHNGNRM